MTAGLQPIPAFHQAGLSLVEIMLVVMLIGLTAAVVIPTLSSSQPYALDLAAQEIAQAMRFARGESIRLGVPHGFLQRSAAGKRIRVGRLDTGSSPWSLVFDVRHPVSRQLYDIQLDDHSLTRVDSIARTTAFHGNCNDPRYVYFDATGSPWCVDPGTSLLEQFDVTLSLGAHTRTVRLDGITGRVSIQ